VTLAPAMMTNIATAAAAALTLSTAWALWRRRGEGGWAALLQLLSALLFFALLFPPQLQVPAATLTVLTPGATPAQLQAVSGLRPTVALPNAAAPRTVERVADLASAPRRYPETTALQIIGGGLPLRDQALNPKLALGFDAAPERGLVELAAPARATLGGQWPVTGRLAPPAVRAELRDPAGLVVDAIAATNGGVFQLSAPLRAVGPARFELRALAADGSAVESASVPVLIEAGERLSAVARLGAPDPEFKYWRRWAADAGVTLGFVAGISEGVALRDGDATLDPTHLTQLDFVVIDERAWAALAPAEKAALTAAVQNGLGLLLRINGPVPPEVAADWQAFGLNTMNLDAPQTVALDRRTGLHERAEFTAAPATVDGPGFTPLLQADDGSTIAAWRALGAGRVGYWRLLDSYRLTLAGESARYGALAAQWASALSRPRPHASQPQLPVPGWVDERTVLCGLGATAGVVTPNGTDIPLTRTSSGCAAYWPAESGWHHLQTGADTLPFYIRASTDAPGLRAARDHAATQAQVNPALRANNGPVRPLPLPRAPLFIAWLLIVAGLWWRERRSL
jgi:hypothetical protein